MKQSHIILAQSVWHDCVACRPSADGAKVSKSKSKSFPNIFSTHFQWPAIFFWGGGNRLVYATDSVSVFHEIGCRYLNQNFNPDLICSLSLKAFKSHIFRHSSPRPEPIRQKFNWWLLSLQTVHIAPASVWITGQQIPPADSPEHLDLIRRVALTLGLAGLDRPDRLGLRSVVDSEVWSEGKKLADRSSRSATTARLGPRRPRPVLRLGWSGFGLGLFKTLRPDKT